MSILISTNNLSYGTPDGRMLQSDLNFELNQGELLLVTGSNGCGKSTLLRILLGETEAMEGSVGISMPEDKVAYIPQLENTEVHMPLTLSDVLGISRFGFSKTKALAFGLLNEDQLDIRWNTASGGERKRTLLTRILMQSPELLIFDEPMNHLDGESRRAMMAVMSKFLNESSSDRPRAILMVCHQGISEEEEALFSVRRLDLDGYRRGIS